MTNDLILSYASPRPSLLLSILLYLHLAKRGFRQVRPSLWTTFTPSFRNVAWLLSAILF